MSQLEDLRGTSVPPTRVADLELQRILLRSGRGDQRAFADFYARTAGFVTALLTQTQPARQVETLTVNTYVAIWRRSRIYDPHRWGVWAWIAEQTFEAAGDARRR